MLKEREIELLEDDGADDPDLTPSEVDEDEIADAIIAESDGALRLQLKHPILAKEQEEVVFRAMKNEEALKNAWKEENKEDWKERLKTELGRAWFEQEAQRSVFASVFAEYDFRRKVKNQGDWERFRSISSECENLRAFVIRCNLRLIRDVARSFFWSGIPVTDLMNEGVIGMNRAIDKFEIERGFKFSTYSTWWVRQQMERAIADTGLIIRVPVHMQDHLRTVRKLSQLFSSGNNGKKPTELELFNMFKEAKPKVPDVTLWQAVKLVDSPILHVASIDKQIGEEGDETALGNLIPGSEDTAGDALEKVVENKYFKASVEAIRRHYAKKQDTPQRHCSVETYETVFYTRIAKIGGAYRTLQNVGDSSGVSRERIRQIQKEILDVLKRDRVIRKLRAGDSI